jgi:hypothetical protein
LEGRRAGDGVLESLAGLAQQAGVAQVLELQPVGQQPDFAGRTVVFAETVKRLCPARIIPSQNTTTAFTTCDFMVLIGRREALPPYATNLLVVTSLLPIIGPFILATALPVGITIGIQLIGAIVLVLFVIVRFHALFLVLALDELR